MRGKNRIILAIDIAFLLVAVLLWRGWEIYSRPAPRGIEISYADYPVRGIDISSHNGLNLDFSRIADQGVKFVYIKATEGETFRDSLFVRNYWGAQRFGLKVGAYHYFRFDCDGVAQARNLLNALAEHPLDLPVAIDVEHWGNPDVSEELIIKRLSDMIATLRNLGYPVMIYTNKKGYNLLIRDHFSDIPLWICSFTDPPLEQEEENTGQWQLWQHSHVGKVDGVRCKLDLNTFNGTVEEFDRWVDSLMKPKADTAPEEEALPVEK